MRTLRPSLSAPARVAVVAIAALAAACGIGGDDDITAGPPATTTDEVTTSVDTETDTTGSIDAGETTATTEGDVTTSTTADPMGDGPFPALVWGIEDGSFDLVAIETVTGEVAVRIAGWGADAADPDREGGVQALSDLDVVGDTIWVGDCCEPAVGSVYGVEPGATTPVPDAEVRGSGTFPEVSPGGEMVAVGSLNFGVAVLDATTGEGIVDPSAIGDVLVAPEDAAPGTLFPRPATWLDDTTLAVVQTGEEFSTITIVSIANPSSPAAVGAPVEVRGTIVDAAANADGNLVLAVEDSLVVSGRVHATDTGEELAVFFLDPDTSAVDYDDSGTFLLVSRAGRAPAWQGLGQGAVLGDVGLIDASWSRPGAPVPETESDTADPDASVDIAEIDGDDLAAAGLEGIGCWFHRGVARPLGPTIFNQGFGGSFMILDGEPVVFDSPDLWEIGDPIDGDDYDLTFEDIGEIRESSIESTERELTLVVTPADGREPTRVRGILWCGV